MSEEEKKAQTGQEEPCAPEEQAVEGHALFVERRRVKRTLLKSRNVILVDIRIDENLPPSTHYVYINDLSELGMRITTDADIPLEDTVRLTLMIGQPTPVDLHPIWKKEIGNKNIIIGLEFIDDSAVNEAGVPALLKWAQPFYGKKSFRINAPIFLETDFEEAEKRFYAYVVVISPGGMEIMNEFPFPEGKDLTLTFTLNKKVPSITTGARVLFQREITPLYQELKRSNNFKVWLEFLEPELIKQHLHDTQQRNAQSSPR